MHDDLTFYVLNNNILVKSVWWEGNHEGSVQWSTVVRFGNTCDQSQKHHLKQSKCSFNWLKIRGLSYSVIIRSGDLPVKEKKLSFAIWGILAEQYTRHRHISSVTIKWYMYIPFKQEKCSIKVQVDKSYSTWHGNILFPLQNFDTKS